MNLFDVYISITESGAWQYEILSNSVGAYIVALLTFFVLVVVFKGTQMLIYRRLTKLAQKTKTDIDDTLIRIMKSLKPQFYWFVAFYLAVQSLSMNGVMAKVISVILIVWVVYQVIHALHILIDYVFRKVVMKQGGDESSEGALDLMSNIVKWSLWVVGLLVILSNLGINITSLVAGLGIGGLAVALAAQNILSDLFSSFSIIFDKPFKIGDFIVVNGNAGTIERIGIKTTRMKSLQGEEIVLSNKMLTSTELQNFGKMENRRVVITVGATYETPTTKLKKVPTILKEIVEAQAGVRFDRSHFKSFDDSALTFETVYYAETSDYTEHMDRQQAINFGIREAFETEGIDMAYPTRTVHVVQS